MGCPEVFAERGGDGFFAEKGELLEGEVVLGVVSSVEHADWGGL